MDCKSYTIALGSQNDSTSPLVTSLLTPCRLLIQHTTPPQHLYLHLTGTFMDLVMDAVDSLALEEGLDQVPRYGWIPKLQQLPILFTHCGRQVQDLQAVLDKKVPPCVHSALGVPYSPPSPSLLLYERVVMLGYVKWDLHLRIVAIRQGLHKPHMLALGFSGEVTPTDERLLRSRGTTRRALRHMLGFVLRSVVAIHTRHCLPVVPSLPDHHAHNYGNIFFYPSFPPTQVPACRYPGPTPPPGPYSGHTLRSCNGSLLFLECHFPCPTALLGERSPTIPRQPLFTSSPPLWVTPHPLASRVSMNASLIFPTPLCPPSPSTVG